MIKLLNAINKGILNALNEQNIQLLGDLDDVEPDQFMSIQTKSQNTKIDAAHYGIQLAIKTGKISERLKNLVNNPKNFNRFKNAVKANNKDHLTELIEIGQKLFGNNGNFNWIDTSGITDMSELFFRNYEFNGHIELWDVNNVTNMDAMFSAAHSFNQPIGDWDVSNVRYMASMFCYAKTFNQTINNWDVSRVCSMEGMFKYACAFNQPLNNWDISRVERMDNMFYGAYSFDQDLSSWDIRRFNLTWGDVFVFCDKLQSKHVPKFK